MPLRVLEETIEDIYKTKMKFDQRCEAQHLPKQTMDEYLQTYLATKYGLRSIVDEMKNSLLLSTQHYRKTSNAACVFTHTLMNEIDEDFRFVERQVKETLDNFIHAELRGANPGERESTIIERKNKILTENGKISSLAWRSALEFMYEKQDAEAVVSLIEKGIEEEKLRSEEEHSKREEKTQTPRAAKRIRETPMIRYNTLLKILQDFQLERHVAYLGPFRRLFREFCLKEDELPSSAMENELTMGDSCTEKTPMDNSKDGCTGNEAQAQSDAMKEKLPASFSVNTQKLTSTCSKNAASGNGYSTGRIAEDGFIQLVVQMKKDCDQEVDEKEIEALLDRADPYSSKLITFTECVRVLADEIEALYQQFSDEYE